MSLVKQFDIAQSAKFGKNKMKLETASFVAKKELPISKFKQIHGLEVKHDIFSHGTWCAEKNYEFPKAILQQLPYT